MKLSYIKIQFPQILVERQKNLKHIFQVKKNQIFCRNFVDCKIQFLTTFYSNRYFF